jgi:hypothetical protein
VFLFEDYTGSTLDIDNAVNPGVSPSAWKSYVQGVQIVMTVPEPSSTALLGLGGLALMLRRKRSTSTPNFNLIRRIIHSSCGNAIYICG